MSANTRERKAETEQLLAAMRIYFVRSNLSAQLTGLFQNTYILFISALPHNSVPSIGQSRVLMLSDGMVQPRPIWKGDFRVLGQN